MDAAVAACLIIAWCCLMCLALSLMDVAWRAADRLLRRLRYRRPKPPQSTGALGSATVEFIVRPPEPPPPKPGTWHPKPLFGTPLCPGPGKAVSRKPRAASEEPA